MFEKLSTLALQEYWWLLVAVIGGAFLFLSFVQGGQTSLGLAKNEAQKDLLINAIGRKWELTFTTLVVFGGALFAAFPLFYAVSFGGAYALWMAILFCFIIQAVAFEYRKKPNNFFGQKTYEFFLLINGSLGIFLIGVAVATFFSGVRFTLDEMHRVHWQGAALGFEALLNPFNIAFGVMLVLLARILGKLYYIHIVADEDIVQRAKKSMTLDFIGFLLFFVAVVAMLLTMDGYTYTGDKVVTEHMKYLHNFLAMPLLAMLFIVGTLLVVGGVAGVLAKDYRRGFWLSGIGTLLVGVSLILLAGFNHTPFYPSISDPASSLTIQNSSGSRYTLITMSYVSLMVPFVIGYIAYVWKMMDKKPLSEEEIEHETMHY